MPKAYWISRYRFITNPAPTVMRWGGIESGLRCVEAAARRPLQKGN